MSTMKNASGMGLVSGSGGVKEVEKKTSYNDNNIKLNNDNNDK